MQFRIKKHSLILLTSIVALVLTGESSAQDNRLTYKQCYENGEPSILEMIPEMEGWLDNDYYLSWIPSEKHKKYKLMKISAVSGEASTFIDFSEVNERFETGRFFVPWSARTADYSGFIIDYIDDLYYFNSADHSIFRLTNTAEKENNPTFSPDRKKVAFTRDHDLFVLDLENMVEKRLTHDGSELIYNGWASWVYYE
jgi:dipeptidyl-peptidase-4